MEPYLNNGTYKLCEEMHDFLITNKANPFYVPSITDLGKSKGGYFLVKKISNTANCLKKFKSIYANYLQEKYLKGGTP